MDRSLQRSRGVGAGLGRAVCVLLALLLWLAAAPASTWGEPFNPAKLRHDLRNPLGLTLSYDFQPFRVPRGAIGALFPGDDVGSAPGEVIIGSTAHPVYLSGRTLFYPPLGPGAFSAMSPLGVAGGNLNGQPAIWSPGQSPLTLPVPGAVAAISLGDIAGVNQIGPKGNRGLIWNYDTGATVPLGFVRISDINAEGWAVGQTDDHHAWFGEVNSGRFVAHVFPWSGDLVHVDNHDWAVGYQLRHGGPWPVEVNLMSDAVHSYRLPHGDEYGSAVDSDDAYVSVVNGFRNLRDERTGRAVPLIYPEGLNHPILLNDRPTVGKLGFRLSDVSGVSDGGILDGAAIGHGSETPVRMHPLRVELKMSILDSIVDDEDYPDSTISDRLFNQLARAYHAVDYAEKARACTEVVNAFDVLDQEASYLDQYDDLRAAYEIAYYNDIAGVLFDLGDELGCNVSEYRPLNLRPSQSAWWTLFSDQAGVHLIPSA